MDEVAAAVTEQAYGCGTKNYTKTNQTSPKEQDSTQESQEIKHNNLMMNIKDDQKWPENTDPD